MKTITISGNFSGSVNRYVRLDVYRPNPSAYDLSKSYDNDFTEVITDLNDNAEYFIDLTGATFGDFELEISGEFTDDTITANFHKTGFKPGYAITTNQ